jgi:1-acyl-sn-glycerol-3-phosphate acyltransferase
MAKFCEDMSNTLGLKYRYSGHLLPTPALLTPNHISWHDVFAIGLKAAPHFVAKAEVADWPVLGYLGKQGDTLFINRGSRQAARAIADQMADRLTSRSVLVFPEGTTSEGHSISRFKRRLFEPAMRVHVPIQPVALHYYGTDNQGRSLGYGNESLGSHLWRTLGTKQLQIAVHFCEPFYPKEVSPNGNDAVAVAQEAQRRVEAAKRVLSEKAFAPEAVADTE